MLVMEIKKAMLTARSRNRCRTFVPHDGNDSEQGNLRGRMRPEKGLREYVRLLNGTGVQGNRARCK